MKIAFFGSPEIASLLLESIILKRDPSLQIAYIFTQPDQPVGKRLAITATPVKKMALKHHIPVFDKPLKENEQEAAAFLKLHEIEVCIVYAYGEILSEKMLTVPSEGYFNVHPSNLPKYRGPTPVAYTLMLGEEKTAVSLIKLDKKMDSGPIIGKIETDILATETRSELEVRLTHLATRLIIESLHKIQDRTIRLIEQDKNEATYTKLLKKEHGYIPQEIIQKALSQQSIDADEFPYLLKEYCMKYPQRGIFHRFTSGELIYNYYRALTPWPGIWTTIQTQKGEKRLKLTSIQLKDKILILNTVQIEGKNEVEFKTFNKAYTIFS